MALTILRFPKRCRSSKIQRTLQVLLCISLIVTDAAHALADRPEDLSSKTVGFSNNSAIDTAIVKEYTYRAGERDSEQDAKLLALNGAKRLVLEEIGSYLQSDISIRKTEIRSEDSQAMIEFTNQRIRSVTAGVIQSEVLESRWDGYTYYIRARFVVNPEAIYEKIQQLTSDAPRLRALDSLQALNDSLEIQNRILNEQIQTQGVAEVRAVLNESRRDRVKKLVTVNNEIASLLSIERDIRRTVTADLRNEGASLLRREQYGQARQILDRAIEINPKDSLAYYYRSESRRALADTLGAFADIEKSVALGLREPRALYLYAFDLAQRGRRGDAAKTFKIALVSRYDPTLELLYKDYYDEVRWSIPDNIGRWGYELLQTGEVMRAMNVCVGGIFKLATGWDPTDGRYRNREVPEDIQKILDAPDTLWSVLQDTLPQELFARAGSVTNQIGYSGSPHQCLLDASSKLAFEKQDGLFARHAIQAATVILDEMGESDEERRVEVLLHRAFLNWLARDWATLLADARTVLRSNPQNAVALAISAVGYGRTGRWKLADSLSRRAIASEENPTTLHIRGWVQRNIGDFSGASGTLQAVISADPNNGEAYFDHAVARYCSGDRVRIVEEITDALRTAPQGRESWVAQAYHFRAMLMDNLNRRSDAQHDRALARRAQSRFMPSPDEKDPQWWIDRYELLAIESEMRGDTSEAETQRNAANRYRAQLRDTCSSQ